MYHYVSTIFWCVTLVMLWFRSTSCQRSLHLCLSFEHVMNRIHFVSDHRHKTYFSLYQTISRYIHVMSHEITLIKLYIYMVLTTTESRELQFYTIGRMIISEPTGAMVKRCTVPVLGMAVNPILLWVIHNAMNHP